MSDVKEITNKIRGLLDQLDDSNSLDDDKLFMQNFNALELPEIVSTIIDCLQPELLPYEAAIYWNLFRKSIIATGQQYTRVSVRELMKDVIKSSSGQSKNLSYATVQNSLSGLEQKKIILKAGETNREGTLYKICLPEEIPLCQERLSLSKKDIPKLIDQGKELDFYNVPENRMKIFERDSYKCHYCNKQLTRFTATLDHLQPVSEGGDNSFENLVTSCLHCNSRRGSRPVMDIISG